MASVVVLTTLWPLRSRQGRGLAWRAGLGIVLAVLLQTSTPTSKDGVVAYEKRGTITVEIHSNGTSRSAIIGRRYGRPFVRSLHDRN